MTQPVVIRLDTMIIERLNELARKTGRTSPNPTDIKKIPTNKGGGRCVVGVKKASAIIALAFLINAL